MKQARAGDLISHASERITDTPFQEAHAATEPDYIGKERMQWGRGSDLEAPPPRPGYVQCWVRTTLNGEADQANIARTFNEREGWKPRDPASVPGGKFAPTFQYGDTQVIGINGMVLAERPVYMQEQRDAYYAEVLRKQTQSVDQDILRVQRPGMPILQTRKTTVSTAPNPAAFAKDE